MDRCWNDCLEWAELSGCQRLSLRKIATTRNSGIIFLSECILSYLNNLVKTFLSRSLRLRPLKRVTMAAQINHDATAGSVVIMEKVGSILTALTADRQTRLSDRYREARPRRLAASPAF